MSPSRTHEPVAGSNLWPYSDRMISLTTLFAPSLQLPVCHRTYRTTSTVCPASSMLPGSRRATSFSSAPPWWAAKVTSAAARQKRITAWCATCSAVWPTVLQWWPKTRPATAPKAPQSRSLQVGKAPGGRVHLIANKYKYVCLCLCALWMLLLRENL